MALSASERDLVIRLQAITSEFTSQMNAAAATVRTSSTEMKTQLAGVQEASMGVQRAWGAMIGVLAGGLVLGGLLSLSKAASEADAQFRIMAQDAANIGEAFDPKQARAFIDQLAVSNLGGVASLSDLRAAFQRLNFTLQDQAEAEHALQVIAAASIATHRDFETVLTAVLRAASGSEVGITRLGLGISAAQAKALGFAGIMNLLEMRTAGVGKAAIDVAMQQQITANRFAELREEVGERLIPVMSELFDTLNRLMEDWERLSPQAQNLILELGGVTIGAAAVAAIFGPLIGLVWNLVKGFAAIAGLKVADMLASAGAAARTAAAGFATLEVTVGVVLAALMALGGFIYIVIDQYQDFYKANVAVGDAILQVWRMVVNGLSADSEVIKDILVAIAAASVGQWAIASAAMKDAITSTKSALADDVSAARAAGSDIAIAAHDYGEAFKNEWEKALNYVHTLFSTRAALKVSVGPAPGSPEFRETDTGTKAAQAAKEYVASIIAAVSEGLDEFTRGVDNARVQVDAAKAALDAYKAGLPGHEVRTGAERTREQELINAQVAAEQKLQAALTAEKLKQNAAADFLLKQAAELSTHLKNHGELYRQLVKAAEEHRDKAAQIAVAITQAGGEVSKLHSEWLDVNTALNDYLYKLDQAKEKAADAAAQAQYRETTRGISEEEHRYKIEYRGRETPVEAASIAEQRAAAEVTLQKALVAAAQALKDSAVAKFGEGSPEAIAQEDALIKAKMDEKDAEQQLTDSQQDLNVAIQQSSFTFQNVLATALQKLASAIPGLSVTQSASGAIQLAFSWQTFLIEAIAQTKSFGDIMRVVAAIVHVVAQIFDALRPIIDLLLKVVIFVVNGFITLYNAIATVVNSLLGWLGIHIALLTKVNEQLATLGAQPLIKLYQDIPTMNQLATGTGTFMPKGGYGPGQPGYTGAAPPPWTNNVATAAAAAARGSGLAGIAAAPTVDPVVSALGGIHATLMQMLSVLRGAGAGAGPAVGAAAGPSSVTVNVTHTGAISNQVDVASIAGAIADSVQRAARTRAWEMSRAVS